jgi:hypothetical protein
MENTAQERDSGLTKATRSRREVLAGAAGAVGAFLATSLVRTTPAHAGTDGDLVLDALNGGESTTVLANKDGEGFSLFEVDSNMGTGITSNCFAGSAPAMIATSAHGEGLYAQTGSTAGTSAGSTTSGVHGVSDGLFFGALYGENVGGGVGVRGDSLTGFGKGVVGSGSTGVRGQGTGSGGIGLDGVGGSGGGVGVLAEAPGDGSGLALDAVGPAKFSLSGLVNIAAGATSKAITGLSLRTGSLVLATPQNNAGVSVAYAVPDITGSKITIHLDGAVPAGKTAKIAWFIVN